MELDRIKKDEKRKKKTIEMRKLNERKRALEELDKEKELYQK